jgi:serine/threonine protein kinase
MAIQTGTRLGEYDVLEVIGRGAMGIVYRAYHRGLGRTVAVKMLHGVGADPAAASSFRREALATAQMRHPNVLHLFDFGEVDGTPYMIVEYVPGGSLADRLRNGEEPSPSVALSLLRGIAAALDYAHGLGVVHRDVKPANVLMDDHGNPVLADFGIAKMLQHGSMTTLGVTKGTPAYMAPEQVAGREVGPAADRYALAIVAYRLLSGRMPFESESILDVIYAQVHQMPPAPSTHNRMLNEDVDAVLLKGLYKKPEDRWETCGAMIDALQAAMEAPATGIWKTRLLNLKRRRASMSAWPGWTAAATGVMAVVVVFTAGFVGLVPQAPTVAVSSSTVQAGQQVNVEGHNLPARQSVTIILDDSPLEIATGSVLKTRRVLKLVDVDGQGQLKTPVDIAPTVVPGDYWIRICWDDTCPAGTPVKITTPEQGPAPGPAPIDPGQ